MIPELERKLSSIQRILTEDSNSGHEMFSVIASKYGLSCISAGGKSKLPGLLSGSPESSSLVIADGAAFGSEMDSIYQYTQLHPEQILLYLPESFEWLILKSGIVTDSEIEAALKDPSSCIDSCQYFSWEQYFTALLVNKTKGTYRAYNKSRLESWYLQDEQTRKIIDTMENG